MIFSSSVFLFLFLPFVLAVYVLLPGLALRNLFLLVASLFFYAWGEQFFVILLILSLAVNYGLGLAVSRWRDRDGLALGIVAAAVVVNIGLLAWFKYADFLIGNLNVLLVHAGVPVLSLESVRLPIGISFFTFQAISYVIDIYRGEARAQVNPLNVGLYISLFPQLVAGPIVRYRQVAAQITRRRTTLAGLSEGTRRFVLGLGKKMILANTVGEAADQIFAADPAALTTGTAWLGVLCYTFQIYFDFSGYSDMAIGLGRIFGFSFPENFNYPYVSRSLREFWRRWHISLSTWFRDYLYLPLGGNRRSTARTGFNLLLVFFLCGLWHGASWNFVIWGMLHGVGLALERTRFEEALHRAARPLRHIYVMVFVAVAWVFFRAPTLGAAVDYLAAMAGFTSGDGIVHPFGRYMNAELALALAFCCLGAVPMWPALQKLRQRFREGVAGSFLPVLDGSAALVHLCWLGAILLASAALLAAGTHNPFIYFRF